MKVDGVGKNKPIYTQPKTIYCQQCKVRSEETHWKFVMGRGLVHVLPDVRKKAQRERDLAWREEWFSAMTALCERLNRPATRR